MQLWNHKGVISQNDLLAQPHILQNYEKWNVNMINSKWVLSYKQLYRYDLFCKCWAGCLKYSSHIGPKLDLEMGIFLTYSILKGTLKANINTNIYNVKDKGCSIFYQQILDIWSKYCFVVITLLSLTMLNCHLGYLY